MIISNIPLYGSGLHAYPAVYTSIVVEVTQSAAACGP